MPDPTRPDDAGVVVRMGPLPHHVDLRLTISHIRPRRLRRPGLRHGSEPAAPRAGQEPRTRQVASRAHSKGGGGTSNPSPTSTHSPAQQISRARYCDQPPRADAAATSSLRSSTRQLHPPPPAPPATAGASVPAIAGTCGLPPAPVRAHPSPAIAGASGRGRSEPLRRTRLSSACAGTTDTPWPAAMCARIRASSSTAPRGRDSASSGSPPTSTRMSRSSACVDRYRLTRRIATPAAPPRSRWHRDVSVHVLLDS